jgi:hypothetical protein
MLAMLLWQFFLAASLFFLVKGAFTCFGRCGMGYAPGAMLKCGAIF